MRLCLLSFLRLHIHLKLHAWWWRDLFHSSSAARLSKTHVGERARACSAYRIIASVCSGRRPTRRWRRRGCIVIWRSRWSGTRGTRLLCGLLLVVLIVRHVILIATVSRIRILAAVILGVASSVICRTAGSWGTWRRRVRSGYWRLRSSI